MLTRSEYAGDADSFYIFEKRSGPPAVFVFMGEYDSLAEAEAARLASENQAVKAQLDQISEEVLELRSVRGELRQQAEQAQEGAQGAPDYSAFYQSPDYQFRRDEGMREIVELVGSAPLKEIVAQTADVVEKMCIETAVELTRNNRVAAAEMLGLSRQSLYVKLRKYGIMGREQE